MQFKPFQIEDYARAALHPGLVLGHDTGLGKSIAQLVLPALWCGRLGVDSPKKLIVDSPSINHQPSTINLPLCPAAPTLLIVPADGHDQARSEAKTHFNASIITLDSKETFLRLSTPSPHVATRQLPPGYYITSYTELTGNGVRPFPSIKDCLDAPLSQDPRPHPQDPKQTHPLGTTPEDVARFWESRAQRFDAEYKLLQAAPTDDERRLKARWFKARKTHSSEVVQKLIDCAYETLRHVAAPDIESLTSEQLEWCRDQTLREQHKAYSAGIGESRTYAVRPSSTRPQTQDPIPQTEWRIRCCYDPALVDLCSESFECVCVDEGTKMKGAETIIGTGVRQMNPRYRLVLTATPIKNRLPDAFSLLHWAANAGEYGNARFPYGDAEEQRNDFAKEFQAAETNLSKSERQNKRCVKLVPQVTNIHRLWKLFAPVVLRRRKKDCGMDIVQKHRHVVRCPMGKNQSEAYRFHLHANYKDKNNMPAIGAKLTALRVCAANPASALLKRPVGDDKTQGTPRSSYGYVPKLASVLNLLRDLLTQNEQALVFSAFHDSLDTLAHRLSEAGVSYVVCDGRMSPKERGRAAAAFKKRKYQVMLAGVESMAELHSFQQCSHVLLMCYSWAFDKFEQAINRVHRLNSPKDVHVWSFICDGSIDGRLEGNIQEKSDSAELVLDGQLLGEQSEEVNLWELLRVAESEFAASGRTALVDEHELEKQWPPLRAEIAAAARAWGVEWGVESPGVDSPKLIVDGGIVGLSTINSPPSTTPSTLPITFSPEVARVIEIRQERESKEHSNSTNHDAEYADLPLWAQAA